MLDILDGHFLFNRYIMGFSLRDLRLKEGEIAKGIVKLFNILPQLFRLNPT